VKGIRDLLRTNGVVFSPKRFLAYFYLTRAVMSDFAFWKNNMGSDN